jgi:hypothetical protein
MIDFGLAQFCAPGDVLRDRWGRGRGGGIRFFLQSC